LKPEWWGSPLAIEEKYQGRKKAYDDDDDDDNSLSDVRIHGLRVFFVWSCWSDLINKI
jgi:hypothetical protein